MADLPKAADPELQRELAAIHRLEFLLPLYPQHTPAPFLADFDWLIRAQLYSYYLAWVAKLSIKLSHISSQASTARATQYTLLLCCKCMPGATRALHQPSSKTCCRRYRSMLLPALQRVLHCALQSLPAGLV